MSRESVVALKRMERDPTYDVAAALVANAASDEIRSIGNACSRLKRLIRCLKKFSFPLVAQPLAGLLTRPENQGATSRLELLIHLAALTCRGDRSPTLRQLGEWSNVVSLQDPIAELDGHVEDVFVSNVVTWFGNVRMFEGCWEGNSYYVQTCIAALLRIADRPWAAEALAHVAGMLRISEAVSERAQVDRHELKECRSRQPVRISASAITLSMDHVSFGRDELDQIDVVAEKLEPFVFREEQAESLVGDSLGHTALERRPIICFKGQTIVALPTAIGAAIRRFTIECAMEAGELKIFQSACHQGQFREVFLSSRPAWAIDYLHFLEHESDQDLREFIGKFDDGGYVHLVFVPDDFEEIVHDGLIGVHTVGVRLGERASLLAAKTDYRRGLTVLVHGGIGRDFAEDLEELPCNWHCLGLSVSDFMLLGNESEFTAMRAWKLLHQVDALKDRGVVFLNLRGFLNLVAFGYYNNFELVPINMNLSPIYVHNDFIAPLRHRVRVALDQHGVVAPDGHSWIPVQRETTDRVFGIVQDRPVFVAAPHMTDREILVCVETVERPWWIRCNEFPTTEWHRGIVINMLQTVVGWLERVAPLLEKHLAILPSVPITYGLRFPDLESLTQNTVPPAEMSSTPVIAFEDGQAVINCGPDYLRSFLGADNSGDRMMIEALVQATYAICGISALSEAKLADVVQTVVKSDNARFFRMTPSHGPQDAIYDATSLPEPRFLLPEDLAWSRLDLARRAGYESDPGPISIDQAGTVLGRAVDVVWECVRSRLASLSRESVVERSLLNFVAVQKDRRDWLRSSSAQLTFHDGEQVLKIANWRNAQRDVASLSCRVIAEMALCTSPFRSGADCAGTDLNFLMGEVATILECAYQKDALYYGLVAQPPKMHTNGSFEFDSSVRQTIGRFIEEHENRSFMEATFDDQANLSSSGEVEVDEAGFEVAFIAEFGLSTEQFRHFVLQFTVEAVETGSAQLRLRRSEVLQRFKQAGAKDPVRAYEGFALMPRSRWDENAPANSKQKDWFPWRFNRRLSILRRPLVQFSVESDPEVLIMPSLLAGTLDYLFGAVTGCLPEDLFDNLEMRSWIGRAADSYGHRFNGRVAGRLTALKWKTKQELSLTQLGGEPKLGDIDVLAWRVDNGLVFVIECKSLRFDRTFGEIGQRLSEYGAGEADGKRTHLQKHLDRISYLKSNQGRLEELTGIPVKRMQVRSVLVTEKLSAMQFTGPVQDLLDMVTEFDLLDESFAIT